MSEMIEYLTSQINECQEMFVRTANRDLKIMGLAFDEALKKAFEIKKIRDNRICEMKEKIKALEGDA